MRASRAVLAAANKVNFSQITRTVRVLGAGELGTDRRRAPRQFFRKGLLHRQFTSYGRRMARDTTLSNQVELRPLTSLRFVAALEVVLFHTTMFGPWGSGGYAAVSFFFVLSGFILTYVYAGPGVRPVRFWRLRLARLAPAYGLGLLIALPGFAYSALVAKILPVPEFMASAILVLTMQQAWWPPAAMAWNAPAWSLSVEFFFYALFPWLLPFSGRVRPTVLIAGSVALLMVSAALRLALPPSNFTKYFPLLQLPLFLFGTGLGRLFLAWTPPGWLLWVGLGGVGLIFTANNPALQSEVLLAPLFGLVILGGAVSPCRMLHHRMAVLLGEVSYALYILHMPLMWWWIKATGPITPQTVGPYLVLVVGASILAYKFVELPLRRRLAAGARKDRGAH